MTPDPTDGALAATTRPTMELPTPDASLRTQPGAPMSEFVAPRDLDLEALDPDARDLMPLFVSTRRADLEALNAALDAGALDDAARVGHRIKGTAQSYGLSQLGELAVELERSANGGDEAAVRRCAAAVANWVTWLEEQVGGENP